MTSGCTLQSGGRCIVMVYWPCWHPPANDSEHIQEALTAFLKCIPLIGGAGNFCTDEKLCREKLQHLEH